MRAIVAAAAGASTSAMMRIVDVLSALPFVLVVILLVGCSGSGFGASWTRAPGPIDNR